MILKGYIYRHYIEIDGKIYSYVGQTVHKPQKRWNDGWGYLTEKTKFSKAIVQYGWDNFKHEILEVVENDNENDMLKLLDELEQYYINQYNSFEDGYNSTKGGNEGGQNFIERSMVVICVTTGEKFESINKAARHYNIKCPKEIAKCARGKVHSAGKHPTSKKKLVWIFDDSQNVTTKKIE